MGGSPAPTNFISVGVFRIMKKAFFPAGLILSLVAAAAVFQCRPSERIKVVYSRTASSLEKFSAKELQRYLFLRSGILAEISQSDTIPGRCEYCLAVGSKNARIFHGWPDEDDLADGLKPEEYLIRSYREPDRRLFVIVGGDGPGALYATYRFLERTGIRYHIDGDVLPDEKCDLEAIEVNEMGKPRFSKRGLQPFHDFNVGPDWWNLNDYQAVLSQMAKLRFNFIGFHTYPSWNPSAGPEANVWIGLPEDVDDQGNVRSGYEAGVVTTRRGWEVKPFPTREYASGAGFLFENDDYGPDFMLDCLDWPSDEAEATAMFNRYGDLQKEVFEKAAGLGIQTCVGTELPLGIPKMLASRLKAKGMNPDDPRVIGKLYEGTFLRIMRKTPVDVFWLWLPEIWFVSEPGTRRGWEITTEGNVQRDISLIDSVARIMSVPFSFATSGWRLGTVKDPLWTHRYTPKSWAISSINTNLGRDPVEKYYGEMPERSRWVIGWAEDDGTAGAHCCTAWDLQLWSERLFTNSSDAFRYGCEGMMAIHWRTASIAPNITALSQAGWVVGQPGHLDVEDAAVAADMELFWENWGRGTFGGEAGARAGRVMQKLEGCHISINQLIDNGAKTTDQDIQDLFAPLDELTALRKEITGTGRLSRFDYWLNYLQATRLRVRTWIFSARLDSIMRQARSIQESEKKLLFVRNQALPLRTTLSRSWEEMISAFVACARSTGEVGTLSSLESGNRKRIVCAHDSTIARILGSSLPAETAIRTTYNGPPRIFVSSVCTQWNSGEPMEIRPFVLSSPAIRQVNLFWRPLGKGRFRKMTAVHTARHAYRVTVPEPAEGCVEYYLQAELADGEKIYHPVTAPEMNNTVVFWK